MKGIIMAGGQGTRLFPMTKLISKHLLPVYDQPMIVYPVKTLIRLGVREILIIGRPQDIPHYQEVLADLNLKEVVLRYEHQEKAMGIAQGLIIGEDFLGQAPCWLILGDNIFGDLPPLSFDLDKAHVFVKAHKQPERFGVAEFDHRGALKYIVEKPTIPPSSYILPGLYYYPQGVAEEVKGLPFSRRGELEITTLNNHYLERGRLTYTKLEDQVFWTDAGTPAGLLEASTEMSKKERPQWPY